MRLRTLLTITLFAPLACGQGADEAPDAPAVDTLQEAEAMAGADAPECTWTAEGEELAERASPPGEATVRLQGDQLRICYSRPSARDREVMGGLVPFGEEWRTGANEATAVHLTFPARIAGIEVEPGSYSLITVPGEEEWRVILNEEHERWGIPIPSEGHVGEGTVPAGETDEMVETFTIELEDTGEGTADMILEWENTRVRIPVERMDG